MIAAVGVGPKRVPTPTPRHVRDNAKDNAKDSATVNATVNGVRRATANVMLPPKIKAPACEATMRRRPTIRLLVKTKKAATVAGVGDAAVEAKVDHAMPSTMGKTVTPATLHPPTATRRWHPPRWRAVPQSAPPQWPSLPGPPTARNRRTTTCCRKATWAVLTTFNVPTQRPTAETVAMCAVAAAVVEDEGVEATKVATKKDATKRPDPKA